MGVIMGTALTVFVEIGYTPKMLGSAGDQPIHWSTIIRVLWHRHMELYRLMGRPTNDDGWVMYPLRGLPSDASQKVKDSLADLVDDPDSWSQVSWITAQELFELQEALAYPEQMSEFHATVAFVKEYKKHEPDRPMRIVYYFSP
ncbi:MAG: hypothetical protein KF726_18360 [Anaerolineae bacterium]|nr:hypothetical protein [Anaerolineae bacterium]